jgi:hypothetical protein
MPPLRSHALLPLLLALGLAAPARPQEEPAAPGEPEAEAAALAAREEAFDHAYARIQDVMEALRWKEAYDRLRKLIDEHQGAAYVIDRLAPLEADLKRCAFWQSHAMPRVEKLLDAKLVTWNRNTGGLRLRIEPGHLGDFRAHTSDSGSTVYELPAQLSDDWTVTLRGTAGGLEGAQVYALLDQKSYALVVGFSAGGTSPFTKHASFLLEGETQTALRSADPAPAERTDDRAIRVEVGEREIQLYVDDQLVVDVERDDGGGFGRMALVVPEEFESIELAGRAESGWLDGLVDAAVQGAREDFERSWKPADHVPGWLLDAAGAEAGREPSNPGAFPMPAFDLRLGPHPRTVEHLEHVQELLTAQRAGEAVRYVQELGPRDADPTLRAFLECFSLYLTDRPREALAAGEKLWSEQEKSLTAGFLQALLLLGLKREPESLAAFQRLAEGHPKAWEPWYAQASLLLSLNRAEEARAVLDRGQQQAAEPAQLRRLEGRIVLLFKGPAWRREFEQRAGHFVVRSDTDVQTCRQVARECDAAWRDYERLFGPVPVPARATVPVFLFAGQASYRAYVADALNQDMQHTAGLFDPYLQAILVWNSPSRETLHETLRHEVLHHYLDARMGALPTWFNEGMAEYSELADAHTGRPALGMLHPEHAALLAQGAVSTDLEALVRQPAAEFYADPETGYPAAWAFVRFLRDTTPARRKAFDDLWQRLDRREDNATALDAAFAGVDWRAWNAEFAEYVRALPSAQR